MNADDRRHAQPSIDVREQLRTTFKVLVDNSAAQKLRIDLEYYKIGPTAKDPVERCQNLVRIRAVDESFTIECRGSVFAVPGRFARFVLRSNVVKPHRLRLLIEHKEDRANNEHEGDGVIPSQRFAQIRH
jgi:hypothetical protein